ncbi:GAL3ST1 [Bugula neritina]|uniref:GAL3ST1 n=1 Tax=Bugula neritina TaxID=10212 RepID=A0A7J7K6M3_BUGNE|nr:GAL3ST1 [Bugula neritina]
MSVDLQIYKWANATLWREISKEKGFKEELTYYKSVNSLVGSYCKADISLFKKNEANKTPKITIPKLEIEGSLWNDPFSIELEDCKNLIRNEQGYTRLFQTIQRPDLFKESYYLTGISGNLQPVNIPETHEFTSTQTCNKVVDFAFVKTHKAGSTTLISILQRFGHTHNLLFALPRHAEKLLDWMSVDLQIYKWANATLWREISKEKGFEEELTYYKSVNSLVGSYCNADIALFKKNEANETPGITIPKLEIAGSPWSAPFSIELEDCKNLMRNEQAYTRLLQINQRPDLFKESYYFIGNDGIRAIKPAVKSAPKKSHEKTRVEDSTCSFNKNETNERPEITIPKLEIAGSP